MVAIDEFLQEHDIGEVDILHSDIQGAELDMLKGCANSIRDNKINFFVVSTHGNKHDSCKKILEDAGYIVCTEHSVEESVSADGLLAAHAPHISGVGKIEITKARLSLSQKVHRSLRKIKQRILS